MSYIVAVEANALAHVLFQELGARDEVVLVVLLEDAQPGGIRERLQAHGGGVDLRRHVLPLHVAEAGGQPDLAHVLHEAEVAVVDRHHHVFLAIPRDGHGCRRHRHLGGGEQREHDEG
jgi:hypothetical protein